MTCQRCSGLMRLAKWWDEVLRADVWFCACINCGGYVDQCIMENRRNPPLMGAAVRRQLKTPGVIGTRNRVGSSQ